MQAALKISNEKRPHAIDNGGAESESAATSVSSGVGVEVAATVGGVSTETLAPISLPSSLSVDWLGAENVGSLAACVTVYVTSISNFGVVDDGAASPTGTPNAIAFSFIRSPFDNPLAAFLASAVDETSTATSHVVTEGLPNRLIPAKRLEDLGFAVTLDAFNPRASAVTNSTSVEVIFLFPKVNSDLTTVAT